ncbi:MAG: hypothetical protein ABJO36_01340 [Litorimonas sp.]
MFKNLCVMTATGILLSGCAMMTESKNSEANLEKLNPDTTATASTNKHDLDGTRIDWIYNSSGSGMILSFEDGLAQYEWVAGARKGRSAENIPYQSRKIGEDMYLINWVQPEKPDFITLIFDFKNSTAFSSGLIGYGTERQRNLFLDGTINSIDR